VTGKCPWRARGGEAYRDVWSTGRAVVDRQQNTVFDMKGEGSMKKWTTLVLALVFVMLAASLALIPTEDVEGLEDDTVFVYLPLMRKDPHCDLDVVNDTGGKLCYEVKGTGIGKKCFSPGTHFYGSFVPGTYSWEVSKSPCGTGSGTRYYTAGPYSHRFWCIFAAAPQSGPSLLQSIE
jgi:hypothetical protein